MCTASAAWPATAANSSWSAWLGGLPSTFGPHSIAPSRSPCRVSSTASTGGSPDVYSASPEEILEYVTQNSTLMFWAAQLLFFTAFAFLWFASVVRTRIAAVNAPSSSHLAALALVGGGVYVAVQAVIGGSLLSATLAPDTGSADATTALVLLPWGGVLDVQQIGLTVFLFAVAFASIRHRAIPRWLGWPAAVLAALFLASSTRTSSKSGSPMTPATRTRPSCATHRSRSTCRRSARR